MSFDFLPALKLIHQLNRHIHQNNFPHVDVNMASLWWRQWCTRGVDCIFDGECGEVGDDICEMGLWLLAFITLHPDYEGPWMSNCRGQQCVRLVKMEFIWVSPQKSDWEVSLRRGFIRID